MENATYLDKIWSFVNLTGCANTEGDLWNLGYLALTCLNRCHDHFSVGKWVKRSLNRLFHDFLTEELHNPVFSELICISFLNTVEEREKKIYVVTDLLHLDTQNLLRIHRRKYFKHRMLMFWTLLMLKHFLNIWTATVSAFNCFVIFFQTMCRKSIQCHSYLIEYSKVRSYTYKTWMYFLRKDNLKIWSHRPIRFIFRCLSENKNERHCLKLNHG